MTIPVTEKPEQEEGFTLIELMVVVLIMGILMAIAIPNFLGAKNSASAKAAEANVRNAVTAEASYFTDNNAYGTGANVAPYETAIAFDSPTTWTSPVTLGHVSVEPTPTLPGSAVLLGAKGNDGNCYWAYMSNGATAYKYDAGCLATSSNIATPTFPASGISHPGGAWAAGW